MTSGSDWTSKVGESWAREWQRTDRSFRDLTERLLQIACSERIERALDIGCGAGELSIGLKDRSGRPVTGVDISEALLAVARQRAGDRDGLSFECADAASWRAPEGDEPDLLVSRHGVMFFEQPVAAFSSLRDAGSNGARLVFSCFRARRDNDWVRALDGIFDEAVEQPESTAPGPFAFGDRDYVAGLLSDAGWREISFEAFDYPMVAGEGASALDDATDYFRRIGPAARRMAELDQHGAGRAVERLRAMLGQVAADDTIALPASAWIVTASA